MMNERLARAGRIPRVHVSRADFQFKHRGDPVLRLQGIILQLLPMLVQVNEPRHNHQPGNIHCRASGQRLLGQRTDDSAADADVPHRIQLGFRINHPTVVQHEVEILSNGECGEEGEGDV